jgi:hypothetical protein
LCCRGNAASIIVAALTKIVAHCRGPRWVAVRPIKFAPSRAAATLLKHLCPKMTRILCRFHPVAGKEERFDWLCKRPTTRMRLMRIGRWTTALCAIQPFTAGAAESFAANSSLTGLKVRPSPQNGTRKIVEEIFSYTNRGTDVTGKFFVRVDVTEEFPFSTLTCRPNLTRETENSLRRGDNKLQEGSNNEYS